MKRALALIALLPACASRQELLAQLQRASTQNHLPKVAACYEHAFESAGFSGEYEAEVDFIVSADTGLIREARVDKLSGTSSDPELERCLVQALDGTSLAAGGMAPSHDVHVSGMRIAFRDASAEARKDAAETTSNVLVGPRADRCLGLWGYDPPRAAPELYKELDDAQQKSRRLKDDADGRARALQRAYDVAIELRERLRLDARQPGIAKESKKRIAEQQQKANDTASAVGAQIGCTPKD